MISGKNLLLDRLFPGFHALHRPFAARGPTGRPLQRRRRGLADDGGEESAADLVAFHERLADRDERTLHSRLGIVPVHRRTVALRIERDGERPLGATPVLWAEFGRQG